MSQPVIETATAVVPQIGNLGLLLVGAAALRPPAPRHNTRRSGRRVRVCEGGGGVVQRAQRRTVIRRHDPIGVGGGLEAPLHATLEPSYGSVI